MLYQMQRALLWEVEHDLDRLPDGDLPVEQYLSKRNGEYKNIEQDYIVHIKEEGMRLSFTVTGKKDKKVVLREAFETASARMQNDTQYFQNKTKNE